jgi:lipopolysaccharide export system protein LptA
MPRTAKINSVTWRGYRIRLAAGLLSAALASGWAAAQSPPPPAPTPAPGAPAAPKPAKTKTKANPPADPAAKPSAGARPDAAAKPVPAPAAAVPPDTPTAGEDAQPKKSSSTLDTGAGSGPIDITSDDGIEMQQSNKVYIARGNAIAKRGDRTLYGDTLMAYYRDIQGSSNTEIWRVVADGHVRITTPNETVEGDHGVYDLDTKTAVMTGGHLKLTTPQDVVTARDALEWYDDKQFAVARGDALGVRADRQIRADILTAQISTAPGEDQRISLINGTGHVVASRPDTVGIGDSGIYNLDTGMVTLKGHVTVTHGENTMRGEYGVVDLEKGISRLLPRPPTLADTTRGRVQGYLVPKKKDQGDDQTKPKPAEPGAAKPAATPPPQVPPDGVSQKAAPDGAKPR